MSDNTTQEDISEEIQESINYISLADFLESTPPNQLI